DVEEIEREVEHVGASLAERLLERLEAALAAVVEDDRLAVEDRGLAWQRRDGLGDRGKPGVPVQPLTSEQADLAAVDARQEPVAVELDLVEPGVAFGRRVDERGELHLRCFGEGRAARPGNVGGRARRAPRRRPRARAAR